jgi:hypothetical protein
MQADGNGNGKRKHKMTLWIDSRAQDISFSSSCSVDLQLTDKNGKKRIINLFGRYEGDEFSLDLCDENGKHIWTRRAITKDPETAGRR